MYLTLLIIVFDLLCLFSIGWNLSKLKEIKKRRKVLDKTSEMLKDVDYQDMRKVGIIDGRLEVLNELMN